MNFLSKTLFAIALFITPVAINNLWAQNNPVIENVPDVGVINYNGKYYLAGVNTNGGFYISDDLVHWKGPVHVFSMDNEWTKGKPFGDNQIHAADIRYWNGKFHFYWSVNYWSVNYWGGQNTTVHVGHAVSDNILGPYAEPDKKNWFDERIDPHLLFDSDSSFYFYTVKFTDGNTIWGQRMADPWTHQGLPKLLFNSLPLTWERMDNSVAEGPEVIKYRSKYYLMYNANHTANTYGNYALGVAEADDPLGFNSGNKYPHPVVQTTLTDDPAKMRRVFSSSEEGFSNWKYTFSRPDDSWSMPDFADADWKAGDKGFGNQALTGSSRLNPQTAWRTSDVWIRKHFKLPWTLTGELQLLVDHAGPAEVLIDGKLVYKGIAPNYTMINLPAAITDDLKTGDHIVAIHSERGDKGAHVDIDLIERLTGSGNDILYNPGQANLLKGPNGFEWWLVYFAIKNGEKKGQFINRVLFNDHELTVGGPTSDKTAGYHPNPGLPVFGDNFDDASGSQLAHRWLLNAGKWTVHNNELEQQDDKGKNIALIKSHAAANYLFKIGVKGNSAKASNAGIIAYYADASNFLEIGLDQIKHGWYYRLMQGGKETVAENKLSPVFNFNVYHSLSVYKNGKSVSFLIDDLPAPGNHQINTMFVAPGAPGAFTQSSAALFDGAVYTPGWDEYNNGIVGWGDAASGKKAAGNMLVTQKGLTLNQPSGVFLAYKGDMLDSYEFATQLYFNDTLSKQEPAGIYPVYVNDDNYLQAGVDLQHGKIVVSGKINGAAMADKAISLKRHLVHYPDQGHSDHSCKVYVFKKHTVLTALEFVKSVYDKHTFKTHLFDSLKVEYCLNGQWKPLKFQLSATGIAAIDRIQFDKITVDAIRVTSAGVNPRLTIYKMYTDEEQTTDYNLRAVKLKDKVILFLDGEQVAEVKGSWPASQVGLFGSNAAVTYNGMMLFER